MHVRMAWLAVQLKNLGFGSIFLLPHPIRNIPDISMGGEEISTLLYIASNQKRKRKSRPHDVSTLPVGHLSPPVRLEWRQRSQLGFVNYCKLTNGHHGSIATDLV